MPTISQLPVATEVDPSDQVPLSQGGVSRAVSVGTLLADTQVALILPSNSLLGRVSLGPGGPEPIALGTGLQISDDVLLVDHSAYPQTGTLDPLSTMLLNSSAGSPQLMPISLLRGLYSPGQNISIEPDGTINSTPAPATGSTIGAVAVGEALVINASGQLSVNLGAVPGTAAAGDDSRITGAEQTAHKNVANGYAGLDVNGLVPSSLLPPSASSPVTSVAGRVGNVVLTTTDIGGLGSVSTQNSNSVNLTGGTAAGVNISAATATAGFTTALPRSAAAHFADYANINDFGLARDGITDDSAEFITAVQTAMSTQRALYIPSGGPILLSDAAQQIVANICIFGDGIRDYDSTIGYGHEGSCLWFTGTTKTPFLLGPNVHFEGITFFWPNQTELATVNNGGLPIGYPPLFTMQSPAQNIVYFNFSDCQVTNCYDFFTAIDTVAVVGACWVERCMIYAIHNCFTLTNVPEVFFIANSLFTWGTYGSVVSVGPTYNLRNFTNTQGTWLKVVGNGTTTAPSTTVVGGIMSCNTYVYGSARGIWLAGGTLDVSAFVNTSFDTVPTVLQGDPGCAIFSTRFTGGTWYPIYFNQTGGPDTTAVVINNPAPAGVNLNLSFSAITVPFVNGSLAFIAGSNISNLSFTDIRCNALGHTAGGIGPYYGFQFNTPNANIRLSNCDFQANNAALSNTGVQITACAEATLSNCVFRNMSAPIDVETTSATITLIGNVTQATQGPSTIVGTGIGNVHDLGNSWDKPNVVYNGFAPNYYRAGAAIGVTPVASTSANGYVGLQPSSTGSGGGTRFGISAFGSSPVSLLTNAFNEEQVRINRQVSAVNYVAARGSLSGSPSLLTAGGADVNASLQICGLSTGPIYLGSAGASGSPVIRLGASVDQSYATSVPSNNFTINMPSNSSMLLLKPLGVLSAGTVILPAAIADGEKVEIWTSTTITALTVRGQTGTIVNNGTAFQLGANATAAFFWNAANNTWFQSLGSGSANGTISGQNANNVAITGGSVTGLAALGVGADSAVSANVVLDTAPGFARQVVFQSASLPRWVVGAEGNAENNVTTTTAADMTAGTSTMPLASTVGITNAMLVSAAGVPSFTSVVSVANGTGVQLSQPVTAFIPAGTSVEFYTNQGSDFAILPYDDTGAPLSPSVGQPLVIARASGQVSINTLAVSGVATASTPAAGNNSTRIATTAFVTTAIAGTAVSQSSVGNANGVASLDAGGHVPASQLPASVQGALDYQGGWNAATNTPTLASGTGAKGTYYTVSAAGATPLDGISQWNAGDHAAFNGTNWEKFDGLASEVLTVAGRTGAVSLSSADIAGLGTMAAQNATAVAISGGTLAGMTLSDATITVPAFAGIVLQGGSATPGGTRGLGAFDGQQYRSAANHVASGQYAVCFGNDNTVSAPGGFAFGGVNTVSSATGYAGAAGGSNNVAGAYSFAFGNSHSLSGIYSSAFGFRTADFGRTGIALLATGFNTQNGDSQRGETILRAATAASVASRLTADGATPSNKNTVNLQNLQAAKVNIEIICVNSAGTAAASWYARDVMLARGASASATALSSTTLTAGGTIGTIAGLTAPTIAADTTNGGIAVTSGFGSGGATRWCARVVSLEVM